jgi:hypothetical protein
MSQEGEPTRNARSSKLCLSQQSEDQQRLETKKHYKQGPLMICWVHLYSLQNLHVLHRSFLTTCLASASESLLTKLQMGLYQLTPLLQLAQVQRSSRKPPEHQPKLFFFFFFFFWVHFSPWSHNNRAQLHIVRLTNTCVSLVKNPSHVCFSKTSFHLCPLQENVPSCVCPNKTPSDTTDFPKNSSVHVREAADFLNEPSN